MTRPERLRLLLVAGGSGGFGTPERALWELATRLPDSRYAVSAWLPPDDALDELSQSLEDRGVPVGRLREPRSRWDIGGLASLRSMFRRARPTLVHLHTEADGAHRNLPAWVRLFGLQHLVVTHHGLPGWEPWPGLAHADATAAVCTSAAESLVRSHGVARERLRVVANGVEPPDEMDELPEARRFRDRLGVGAFRPLWVCAARFEDIKGHETLLDALHRVAESDLDFVVALAGEGARRAGLERRAKELGLGNQIHFLGSVESLGPLLLAADAVVLASREEAQPLSILEAMVRSRAVVASGVGGLPDLIEDGVSGLLVAPGDPEALANALATLHQKADFGRRLGLQAGDRARGAFTWAHTVARYESIYDELIGLAGFTPEPHARGRATPAGSRA